MTVRRTKIGYADFSGGDLNFVIGCTSAGPECANCYARTLIEDRQGRDFSKVRLFPEKLERLRRVKFDPKDKPFRRGPDAKPILFPVDLGDIFHYDVPDDFLCRAFDIMATRDDADWLVLTKRPERLLLFQTVEYPQGLPPNVWAGTTVGTQAALEDRGGHLSLVEASVRWLSMEPLLERITFDPREDLGLVYRRGEGWRQEQPSWIDWIAVGAESGRDRRHFERAWAQWLYGQVEGRGIAFFGKQDSGLYPGVPLLIYGREIKEFPR